MIFNPISKTIKDPDNIEEAMRAKNIELGLSKVTSYFHKMSFSTNRESYVPESSEVRTFVRLYCQKGIQIGGN